MPRPPKPRRICPCIAMPQAPAFPAHSPAGNALPALLLEWDELEALRLSDLEELSQEDAANCMSISRGTLQRLLYTAHKKVAFALLHQRALELTPGAAVCPGVSANEGCSNHGKCRYCPRKTTYFSPHYQDQGECFMKIAVTCENHQVFQHFGHTQEFAVFETQDGKILSEQIVSAGTAGHGALAGVLALEHIELLICGGIGGGAQMALAEHGIALIGGATGDVRSVVEDYLAGKLATREDFSCHHHDHEAGHSCQGGHGEGAHSCGSGSCH